MRTIYTYIMIFFWVMLHSCGIGCQDETHIKFSDDQLQLDTLSSYNHHSVDNISNDIQQICSSKTTKTTEPNPLKILIRTQGGDDILFWGTDRIAVDCYNNGSYNKELFLNCYYKNAGYQQVNIINESKSDVFVLKILSKQQSSYFVSIIDWGDFRDGWSLYNLLPGEPDSENNTGEVGINLESEKPFKLTYQTYRDNTSIDILALSVYPYIASYAVDCDGDGIFEKKTTGTVSSCHYPKKGKHQIALIGTIPSIRLFDDDDYSLLSIDQWGTNVWRSMHYFMAQTKNAVIKAKDVPDLSHVKDMSEMFKDALKMNSDINHWDVSGVTNMQEMFCGAKSFNKPLDKWNTSSVVNMTGMFARAESFNQNINDWNVSNVRYMSGMFYKATKFNQLLDKWDVSHVEYMADMFAYTKYNRPLHNWNVASLLDPCGMFEYATNDKYIFETLEYYFRDSEFKENVYGRLESIGRVCLLHYNHRTDPWKYPEESEYYPYFKDDHDVYQGRF